MVTLFLCLWIWLLSNEYQEKVDQKNRRGKIARSQKNQKKSIVNTGHQPMKRDHRIIGSNKSEQFPGLWVGWSTRPQPRMRASRTIGIWEAQARADVCKRRLNRSLFASLHSFSNTQLFRAKKRFLKSCTYTLHCLQKSANMTLTKKIYLNQFHRFF